MKWMLIVMMAVLLSSMVAEAEELYQYDSLELNLKVAGALQLIPIKQNAQLEDVTTELYLYPADDYRQELQSWKSEGTVQNKVVKYFWADQEIETKKFEYTARVKTKNERVKVKRKVLFPLSPTDVSGMEQYLHPTVTIDSNNPDIIAKATQLAEGEDDLFKVAFTVANWVDSNVAYDLNTLTASASQKASWVLDNRQGVCDEMTSLFIAMMRALGVPARFVSGVSYTTSELFTNPWQPHGWAEVYFPNIGWVSFDITFGQYGYVDVTHVKLREGFDPKDPAIEYRWRSDGVKAEAKELDLTVLVIKQGSIIPEEVQLEQEVLGKEVGIGSYNLIKGLAKNTADYYAATTLQVAVPSELEVRTNNRRTILLHPKEVRETYWMVKVPSDLSPGYVYTFPIILYSEENNTIEEKFVVKNDATTYALEEIEQLTIQDEEKAYSRKVSLECDYPQKVRVGKNLTISCTFKNSGNTNLQEVEFCLGGVCETMNLPINQKKSVSITVAAERAGPDKVIASAKNDLVEKRVALGYTVLDDPKIKVNLQAPAEVQYGENFNIVITLEKESFNLPQEVVVVLEGTGFENTWELSQLPLREVLTLELGKERFSSKNKYKITVRWKDMEGKMFSEEKEITVRGKANTFSQKIVMGFNRILGFFF